MIVMIDNYDSFTYNLVQYLEQLGAEVKVFRNDKIDLKGIYQLKPHAIVISPGPGRPESAGISLEVVRSFYKSVPILGVCLGHQTIAVCLGAKVVPAQKLMHGKTSEINADGLGVYQGIKSPFSAMRYHSLAVERTLPDCLKISASTADGEIMGIRHKQYPVEGIQFHPESIMTTIGKRLLRNFIKIN